MIDVLRWLAIVEGLGVAVLPLVWAMFAGQPTRGAAYARPLSVLLLGMVAWLLAALHLLPQTLPLLLVIAALITIIAWAGWGRALVRDLLRLDRRALLLLALPELLFLVAFAWQLFAISLNPDLYVSEKPMNFTLVQAASRSSWVPPQDPWLSGHTINYYYFGHYVVALLIALTGSSASVGFSLAEATLFGSVAAIMFSITFDVVAVQAARPSDGKKGAVIPLLCGLGATWMALFTGNLVPLYRAISDPSIVRVWLAHGEPNWWTEPYSIHGILSELPWRTFSLSQLHSSDIALPLFLTVFAWGAQHWLRRSRDPAATRYRVAGWPILALLLAGTALTSPWVLYPCLILVALTVPYDLVYIFVHLPVVSHDQATKPPNLRALISRWSLPASRRAALQVALAWAYVAGVALALVALFVKGYDAPRDLLMLSTEPAQHIPPLLFFQQFGVRLAALLIVLPGRLPPLRDLRAWRVPIALLAPLAALAYASIIGLSAAIAVLLWVLIALAIFHRARQRQVLDFSLVLLFIAQTLDTMAFFMIIHDVENTFYKLGFLAWIIGSIALFAEAGTLWCHRAPQARFARWVAPALLIAILLVGAWMPAIAVANSTNQLHGWGPRTLDGVAFHFALAAPADYDAILWLDQHAEAGAIILEISGDSFSQSARVSTATGLPAVLGWHAHELLWHQSQPDVLTDINQRIGDVDRIYQTRDADEARCLLQKYDVAYVFIGRIEHEAIAKTGLPGDEQQAALDKFAQFMDRAYPAAPQTGAEVVIYKMRAAAGTPCRR
jgi:YYY domain-containing protein